MLPRRDLGAPVRPTDTLPLRIPAGRPEIHGAPRPISGYSLCAAFGLPRATVYHVWSVFGLAYSAGVRQHDLLYSINGRRILAEADMLEAVNHRRTGDVVPVRLERAGKMIDLLLPLAPQTRYTENNYRADDFPTVIECAVPFYSYECGGPIVDLSGRAIGVTIARVGFSRRHGHPRRLRSEVIARFAEWPISRKLGARSRSWQVTAWRDGTNRNRWTVTRIQSQQRPWSKRKFTPAPIKEARRHKTGSSQAIESPRSLAG